MWEISIAGGELARAHRLMKGSVGERSMHNTTVQLQDKILELHLSLNTGTASSLQVRTT